MNPYLLAVTTTTTTNAPPQPQVSVEVTPRPDIATTLIGALERGSFPIALIVLIVGARYGGKFIDAAVDALRAIKTDSQLNRDAVLKVTSDVQDLSELVERHDESHKDIKGSLDRLEDASKAIISEVRELKDSQETRRWF